MNELTNGYDLLARLFDAGTFSETGICMKRSSVGIPEGTAREGVITGYGSVNGSLVFAFAQSSDRAKGAMTEAQAEKILRLYDLAEKSGGAVVGVFDCAGAYVEEGSRVLSAYAALFAKVNEEKGVIPQIAWINGACTGMNAALAASFDFSVLNGKDADASFTPAFLQNGAKQSFSASLKAEDETDAANLVRRLLSLLTEEEEADDALLNRASEGISAASATDEILSALGDGESIVLGADGAPETVTALTRIAGRTVGVLLQKGKLTASGAKKAARFLRTTDMLGIAHLNLIDSEGAANEDGCETGKVLAFASLASAASEIGMPLVSVVLGSACGASFSLLASHAIGADLVFALEGAQIGVLAPQTAAQFAYGEERKNGEDIASLTEKWNREHDGLADACRAGDVDEVLPAAMLRPKTVYAFEMLMHGVEE